MTTAGRPSFVRDQLPAIAWALLIFISSSIPGRVFPDVSIPHVDKVVHFCYYFGLAFFVAHALQFQWRFPGLSRFSLPLSFLLATVYGVLDEMHQLFVPQRSFELPDLVADMSGALAAVLTLWILQRKRKARVKKESQ